jgi:alanyl-tRNA synthetase
VSEVEKIVNEKVIENMPVDVSETSLDDAISKGVVALFGEKYGEKVRVVKAGDYSAELCGGIHCSATGDIGPFKITSEGSVASGIRRIEALTGFAALAYINEEERELKKTAEMLKTSPTKLSDKAQKLISDIKKLEKELVKARSSSATQDIGDILDKVVEVGGVKMLSHKIDGLDMKTLRDLADKLKDKLGSGIVVLGSSHNGQASYVSAVTKDLTDRFHAGKILKKVTGGKGGGRADMAQGGTKDTAGIAIAISSVIDIIKEEIEQKD